MGDDQHSDGISVRLYRPGDEAGIADLLSVTFPAWPKIETPASPTDHVRWKLSSDSAAHAFQVVAEAGGRIVGCRLFFVTWFRVTGLRLLCRQGFDLAVHPDVRGRGVLNTMWAFAREQFDDKNDFNFGVGAHPAALHMRVGQGNISIGNKVQVLTRSLSGVAPAPSPDLHIQTVSSFDQRADALFERAAVQFDFIRERGSAYLNWRHADPRSGRFTLLTAQDKDDTGIVGYAVLCQANGTGTFADLLALPGRLDVVGALVARGVDIFSSRSLSAAECWMPSRHPYRSVLLDAGFTKKKRTIPLSYRHLRAPADHLVFLSDARAAIHIMANDTDLV